MTDASLYVDNFESEINYAATDDWLEAQLPFVAYR